ncbi:MAG: hypothetical protein AB7N76_28785 [Planctomycetota bacterium]
MSIEVEALEPTPAGLADFVELPYRVYRDDARWIPPFRQVVLHELTGPGMSEGHEWQCFLARRDGEPAARAAAIVNPALAPEGRRVGLVGYFEAFDDPEAIAAVLDAARAWLSERGRGDEVWGPFNHTICHDYRFMTKGFEREVFFGEPYNPAYYPARWQECGFAPLAPWSSWDLYEPHLRGMHQAAGAMKVDVWAEGYEYRPFDLGADFERDLRHTYDILLDAFAPNLGFTPLPYSTFVELYAGMRAFLVPELAPIVVDPSGAVIGLGFLYPDPGHAIRALGGDAARAAELPGLLAATPPTTLVFHTMAVLKPARRKGMVEAYLERTLGLAFERGIKRGIGALAKQGPTIYHKTGEPTREYTLFRLGG